MTKHTICVANKGAIIVEKWSKTSRVGRWNEKLWTSARILQHQTHICFRLKYTKHCYVENVETKLRVKNSLLNSAIPARFWKIIEIFYKYFLYENVFWCLAVTRKRKNNKNHTWRIPVLKLFLILLLTLLRFSKISYVSTGRRKKRKSFIVHDTSDRLGMLEDHCKSCYGSATCINRQKT